MGKPRLALGLMTGTALDGAIDVAILRTDGRLVQEFGPWALHPYGEALRAQMAEAVAAARAWNFAGPEPACFAPAERAFTLAHAEAVKAVTAAAGVALTDLDVIGLHGLTVLHRPPARGERGATRQLGDGPLLAQALGVDVVWDFRSADVAAGGQGAPLAPAYHSALLTRAGLGSDTAVLNLGGVANLTWAGGGDALAAFDCGPANGPINEWMEACGLGVMDKGGRLAASGQVREDKLKDWLAHPFFAAPWPKSLDRYDFSATLVAGLSPADGAATLTALAGAAVGRGLDLLPVRPTRVIVSGGGRKNPALMREIESRAGAELVDCDTLGWRGDAIEAEAFAFLAVRALEGLPLSFPGATGAPAPLPGGRIARA